MELNGANESTIYHPGDQIIVSSTSSKPASQKSSKTSKSSSSKEVYHTIVDGDTLGHIAVKYDTTVKRICELNNMGKDDILKLGRKLRVK
jgi:teichoic acid transport system ATP-binding protein